MRKSLAQFIVSFFLMLFQFDGCMKLQSSNLQNSSDQKTRLLKHDLWKTYQYGSNNASIKKGSVSRSSDTNDGDPSIQLENETESSNIGIYQNNIGLKNSTYKINLFAKNLFPDQNVLLVQLNHIDRCVQKTFENRWKEYNFFITVDEMKYDNICIRLQTLGKVLIGKIKVEEIPLPDETVFINDLRTFQPKMLLFSAIHLQHLLETVEFWSKLGFNGFLVSGLITNWNSGLAFIREHEIEPLLKKTNIECQKNHMDSNFIKIAFYTSLPGWDSDTQWGKLNDLFKSYASLALKTGCKGLAIDMEYINDTYYANGVKEIKLMARNRGKNMMDSIVSEFSNIEILILPNGIFHYGELYREMIIGFIQSLKNNGNENGIHLFDEYVYDCYYPETIIQEIDTGFDYWFYILPEDLKEYWNIYCSIAPGAWPVGRESENNYYQDKSQRYSPELFHLQLLTMRKISKKYYWIYGHGAALWCLSKEKLDNYKGLYPPLIPESQIVGTSSNLDTYLNIIKNRNIIRLENLHE